MARDFLNGSEELRSRALYCACKLHGHQGAFSSDADFPDHIVRTARIFEDYIKDENKEN